MAVGTDSNTTPGGYSKNDFCDLGSSTNDFVRIDFTNSQGNQFLSGYQTIQATGPKDMDISWDGVNVHAVIVSGGELQYPMHTRECVFVRSTVAGMATTYMVLAW